MYQIYLQNLERITLDGSFRLQDFSLQLQIHCTSSSKIYDHSNILFHLTDLKKYRFYKDIKPTYTWIYI